jgi:hypothetical protein
VLVLSCSGADAPGDPPPVEPRDGAAAFDAGSAIPEPEPDYEPEPEPDYEPEPEPDYEPEPEPDYEPEPEPAPDPEPEPPIADGGEPPQDLPPPDPRAQSVLVYSNNIENMLFDWKDLVHVMARDKRKLDLFFVQQLTSKKRLDELADTMTRRLGEKYIGVVAQDVPTNHRFAADVLPKPTVTTGLIWRARRFAYLGHKSWFPWGRKLDGVHTCAARTSHSGYETIRVLLQDNWAQRRLAAVSLRHWTWKDCSQKNMIEMIDKHMPDVAMQIVAGDFNGKAFDASGDYRCWYKVTLAALGGQPCANHANLGFTDPLYEACGGVKSCVKARSGIDFVFGRVKGGKPAVSAGFDVVSYARGDAADIAETGSDKLSNHVSTHGFSDVTSNYSQHRARRAVFFY